ncbi:MAG TPA: hypothetical protein VF148_08440 [Acidimicrobiia bacterium]
MRVTLLARSHIEMSDDPSFLPRVRRLSGVSSIVLGIIWLLAMRTTEPHNVIIDGALFAGWILMPTVLWTSIRRPEIRPWVFLPSTLITLGLGALCLTALPTDSQIVSGWLLVTAGILFGGFLGGWFWFRWLPVPASLDAPFASGRWALIGAHVLMIVAGLVLVALGFYL